MKPIIRKISKKGYCLNCCPYLQPFIHPFFCHSAWCNYILKSLCWYDGAYIAQCKRILPDETCLKLVENGWKGNPEYKILIDFIKKENICVKNGKF